MVTLRDAIDADCAAIARLHAESWRSAYRGILSDEYLDSRAHSDRAALWQSRFSERASKPFFVILAEIGSQLAGFACVFPNEDQVYGAFVDNLHVTPQLTRQGIGRRLLNAVGLRLIADQSHAKQPHTDQAHSSHGHAGIYLWAIEQNLNARRFYSRVGAVEVGSEAFAMPDGRTVREVRCCWPNPARLVDATAIAIQ
jgi:GNAT superfamily N-acetyltransferase